MDSEAKEWGQKNGGKRMKNWSLNFQVARCRRSPPADQVYVMPITVLGSLVPPGEVHGLHRI
ncbi:MAG: hypothetical protein ACI8W8_002859 [Rhodothermales bacterium]|jgi:hypothetical protein